MSKSDLFANKSAAKQNANLLTCLKADMILCSFMSVISRLVRKKCDRYKCLLQNQQPPTERLTVLCRVPAHLIQPTKTTR